VQKLAFLTKLVQGLDTAVRFVRLDVLRAAVWYIGYTRAVLGGALDLHDAYIRDNPRPLLATTKDETDGN
jgi:hypothetical protein